MAFLTALRSTLALAVIVLATGCGKTVEDTEETQKEVNDETPDGTYFALLMPVNQRLSAQVHGEVQVLKYGDEFRVTVDLKDAPRVQISQYLHTGRLCPKAAADTNGDGFVDRQEARRFTGPAIVPFDGDLSTQQGGPAHRLTSSYRYTRSSSYYLMLYDLHLPDEILNDDLVKLSARDLPLERRAVSVFARSSLRPGSTLEELPLACGILTRLAESSPPDERPIPSPETSRDGIQRIPRLPEGPRLPEVSSLPVRRESWWDRLRNHWRWWRFRKSAGAAQRE